MKITEANQTKMFQISTSRTKMMINSKPLLVCLLIVIVSSLGARVVPTTGKERTTQTTPSSYESNHGAQAATVAVANGTGEQTSDKTKSNKQSQTDVQLPAAKLSSNRAEQQANNNKKCEYDKGQWDECELNGAQQKVMKLKWGGPECKPTKTIRRDCKAKGEVGCKYARGEWSSECQDGLRVRVDTLVGPVGGAQANELARSNHVKCKPQRRVTKDCRRTCHYTKSAWSECTNGFRTRMLTLVNQVDSNSAEGDESGTYGTNSEASNSNVNKQPLAQKHSVPATASQTNNQICVRQKLIRRKCTPAESKTTNKSSVQQQQQRENSQQASSTSSNLTPAQRRRLKQLQLKQQQQPTQRPKHAASSQSPTVTTTGAPQPTTTTTTNKVRTTSRGDGSNSSGSTLATVAPVAGTTAKSGR